MHECKQEEAFKELKKEIGKLFGMSLPTWVRSILIGCIGLLFLLYGGMWAYAATTYASKQDVKELRSEINDGIREILQELRKK